MTRTRHMHARMSQRAISGMLVDLTRKFGIPRDDGKIVLNRKGVRDLQEELRRILQVAERALQKGGVIVVEEDDNLITTYPLGTRRGH